MANSEHIHSDCCYLFSALVCPFVLMETQYLSHALSCFPPLFLLLPSLPQGAVLQASSQQCCHLGLLSLYLIPSAINDSVENHWSKLEVYYYSIMAAVKKNFCKDLHQHIHISLGQVKHMNQCWLVRVLGARMLSKKSGSINCWYPRLLYHSFRHKEQILG